MKKAVALILLCCLSATLLSCGGSNSTIVFISPAAATVNAGATLQFTANVPVTWSVTGNGVIDAAGFFKAGNTAGTVTINAFATDGSRSGGTATVTISATGTTTTTTAAATPSGIIHRVFVSNKFSGVLNIVNADTDLLSAHSVSVGGSPTFMLQTSDLTAEVVYDSTNNILAFVNNKTEAVSTKIPLAGATTSVAIIPGATAAYVAVPTAVAPGSSVTGSVYRADFSGGILSVGVQGARFISMDHNAVNMLAFSQNCDTVTLVTSSAGALTSNTGTLTGTVLPSGATNCTTPSFSRPVAAVFSADDHTAYVLSSGPVNGGAPGSAMVTVLDMTQSPPAVLKTIPVSGANVGLLQGTQLYVAGATIQACSSGFGQCQQGVLSVIDTTTNTAGSPVPLDTTAPPNAPNLLPGVLTFDGTNLWIGSTGCQVSAGAAGCLSLYFPATGQAVANTLPGVLTDQNDDVTGMVWLQPFNNRKIMYVIEGGELLLYDNAFNLLTQSGSQIIVDIIGQAVDIKAVK